MAEYNGFSLREAAQYDYKNNAKDKLTGWGIVCKNRTGENSKSQKRKKSRK